MASNPHDMPGGLYDEASERVGNHAHEILFGLTYEHVCAGQRLLDVGIGTGLSSVLFHRAGLEIEGVDFAEGMLDACRRKGIARRLTVHDLSVVPWPFGDASFDHVTCCGVLHFVRDIGGYLGEVRRSDVPVGLDGGLHRAT